jgi:hypothetical protein
MQAVGFLLQESGRRELGCEGDACKKLQMDPDACEGCPRDISDEIEGEENDWVPYALLLLDRHEELEMGLNPDLAAMDRRFMPGLRRLVNHARDEVYSRRRKLGMTEK